MSNYAKIWHRVSLLLLSVAEAQKVFFTNLFFFAAWLRKLLLSMASFELLPLPPFSSYSATICYNE